MESLVVENVFFEVGGREILCGATIRADMGKVTCMLAAMVLGKAPCWNAFLARSEAMTAMFFTTNGK